MKSTQRLALCAIMVAVMLTLGWLESLLPLSGVPGIKLGLSNSVLVIALYWLGFGDCFIMMGAKVALIALMLGGSPASALYGFAGGALSLCAMALLRRVKGVSPVGVGIAGGALHNVGQVLVAMLVLKTPSLVYYMAVLLPVGAGMGFVTGTVAALLIKRLKPPTGEPHPINERNA